MPLIPALGRQRYLDVCEFEASMAHRASFRTGSKATERKPKEKKEFKEQQNISIQANHQSPSPSFLSVH